MNYIIDVLGYQEVCNGIECKKCPFLDNEHNCKLETYIRNQKVYQETQHGEWIDTGYGTHRCSVCGEKCRTYRMNKPRDRYCLWCGTPMSANDRQVTGKLNSEIENSKSEIVPDYRDGWKLKGGDNK